MGNCFRPSKVSDKKLELPNQILSEMETLELIRFLDKPFFVNIHPMHLGEEKWEAMDNVDCQQITLAEKIFKQNKGDPAFRFRTLGLWTADLLEYKLVLTKDMENAKMFRKFIGGDHTQERRRPGGKRTAVPILIKKKIDEGGHDFGWTWAVEFNNGGFPSYNQIRIGLTQEARFQIRQAMGDAHKQYKVVEAEDNAEQTWNKLIEVAKVLDPDAPLKWGGTEKDSNGY